MTAVICPLETQQNRMNTDLKVHNVVLMHLGPHIQWL